VGQFEPTFQAKTVVRRGSFFVDGKLDTFFLSFSEDCSILRLVVLTQYRRVTDIRTDRRTDGRRDGIAIASTALAMRAVRHAVKRSAITLNKKSTPAFQRAINQACTPPLTSPKCGSPLQKSLRSTVFYFLLLFGRWHHHLSADAL